MAKDGKRDEIEGGVIRLVDQTRQPALSLIPPCEFAQAKVAVGM